MEKAEQISVRIEGSYWLVNKKWMAKARFFLNEKYDPEQDEVRGPFDTKVEAVAFVTELRNALTNELKALPDFDANVALIEAAGALH